MTDFNAMNIGTGRGYTVREIDTAFKDIKTATGVTDVQELVKRFLIRE